MICANRCAYYDVISVSNATGSSTVFIEFIMNADVRSLCDVSAATAKGVAIAGMLTKNRK